MDNYLQKSAVCSQSVGGAINAIQVIRNTDAIIERLVVAVYSRWQLTTSSVAESRAIAALDAASWIGSRHQSHCRLVIKYLYHTLRHCSHCYQHLHYKGRHGVCAYISTSWCLCVFVYIYFLVIASWSNTCTIRCDTAVTVTSTYTTRSIMQGLKNSEISKHVRV